MYIGNRQRRIITVIVIAALLFISGRFYREINEFFYTPASAIGLLFSVIGILCFVIMHMRVRISEKRRSEAEAHQSCEEYRRDISIIHKRETELQSKLAESRSRQAAAESAERAIKQAFDSKSMNALHSNVALNLKLLLIIEKLKKENNELMAKANNTESDKSDLKQK